MGSAVILGSSYASDGSQFYVRDATYMYTDTSSTTHAEISSYSYNTSSHYLYLRGFSFSGVIPSGMTATSTTVKVNLVFPSGLNSSSSSYPRLCNGTTVIGNAPTVSGNIYTFGGLDWDTISGYGNNFGIRFCIRKKNAYSSVALSVYGAEIDVEYSEPVSNNTMYIKVGGSWVEASAVYKKVSGSWVEQADLTSVFDAGTNYVKGN